VTDISRRRLQKRFWSFWSDCGLPDEDRYDLAVLILGHQPESFSHLSNAEWQRLGDAVVGWHAVEHMRRERGL
jgi:hypothetical protein